MNSEWLKRLGTIRALALGTALAVVGIIWLVQH